MLTLLHLLSAVALLVWGTHIVRTGVMRVYGARLRTVLSSSVEKKPLAFCAGLGVTALVQSSNATTMLVTSFVARGFSGSDASAGDGAGADVGTALMASVDLRSVVAVAVVDIYRGDFLPRPQADPRWAAWTGGDRSGADPVGPRADCRAVHPITRANGVQVIFASLTGDIMLDALIGAVFAIISYSSGGGAVNGDADRGGSDLFPGGAVSGDWRQHGIGAAGDA